MGRLANKIAIITGAARGIGATSARLFAAEGARVVLTDVDAQGEAVAQDIGEHAMFLRHDISCEQAWEDVTRATQDHFGAPDILVNNAGILHATSLFDTTLEDFERVQRVNQTGVFLGLRTVGRMMAAADRGGSIVNISSVSALKASLNTFTYGTSKWAVRGMSRLAAGELAEYGIRVNSVHPGLIGTAMTLDGLNEAAKERIMAKVPLRRMGQPEDVAQLILFLASDESSYMTGTEGVTDGGLSA